MQQNIFQEYPQKEQVVVLPDKGVCSGAVRGLEAREGEGSGRVRGFRVQGWVNPPPSNGYHKGLSSVCKSPINSILRSHYCI